MRSSTSHGSTDWACPDSPDLKLSNRLVRTRMPGGVAGEPPVGGPLCRLNRVSAGVVHIPALSDRACGQACRRGRPNLGVLTGPWQRDLRQRAP